MIKTTAILKNELKEYRNPNAKIRRLVEEGKLIPIIRGLYETDGSIPGYCLASIIYGPSYLSFEFALAYYSLIPEAVYTFTSATFEKKKEKQYSTPFGNFTYRDVPSKAYPAGVLLQTENGYGYKIATAEKAICDQLYKTSPVDNQKELQELLFDDLRIDRDDFFALNLDDLYELSSLYSTKNHKLLQTIIKRSKKNESNY